jgi:hypothetical protein
MTSTGRQTGATRLFPVVLISALVLSTAALGQGGAGGGARRRGRRAAGGGGAASSGAGSTWATAATGHAAAALPTSVRNSRRLMSNMRPASRRRPTRRTDVADLRAAGPLCPAGRRMLHSVRGLLPQHGRRSMGTSGGDEPACIVPRGSKPWRRYREMFRGLVDSRYAGSLSRSHRSSAYSISASP